MNNMIVDRYKTRADMNAQVYEILDLIPSHWKRTRDYYELDQLICIIIVSHEVENDNDNNQTEWNGFARTIKNFNKKQFA